MADFSYDVLKEKSMSELTELLEVSMKYKQSILDDYIRAATFDKEYVRYSENEVIIRYVIQMKVFR